jgi:hypothetical protein
LVAICRKAGRRPDQTDRPAQAGLNLDEFDAATQAHGLATTMGVNSDAGVAGLTLGGGLGVLDGYVPIVGFAEGAATRERKTRLADAAKRRSP